MMRICVGAAHVSFRDSRISSEALDPGQLLLDVVKVV